MTEEQDQYYKELEEFYSKLDRLESTGHCGCPACLEFAEQTAQTTKGE